MPAWLRFSTTSAERPVLHWDGQHLSGDPGSARSVIVTVPARLALLRSESVPAAEPALLRQAVRLKAERHTAVLGPAVVDAVIAPPRDGACAVLLAALPQTVIAAIRHAAAPRTVAAIHLGEAIASVDADGVAEHGGETALIHRRDDGFPLAIIPLGRGDDPACAGRLKRERLRLGTLPALPNAPTAAAQLDFQAPRLTTAIPWRERPGFRVGALMACIVLAVLLAGAVTIGDALSARTAARDDLARLQPLTDVLAARRADTLEVRSWFADRPQVLPALAIFAAHLPASDSSDNVRLTRIRQVMESGNEPIVAEGLAGDRAQLLAFVGRLRSDPRIASAEVRSFRSPGAGAAEVAFELAIQRADGASHGLR